MKAPYGCTALALLSLVSTTGCGADEVTLTPGPGTWRGEVRETAERTVVVTHEGSAWTGTYRLAPDFTVGSKETGDAIVFGALGGIVGDSERILAVDAQESLVRVFGWDGRYQGDIGRHGEGPGEFLSAKGIGIDAEGRLLVQDNNGRKIHVFDSAGQFLAAWPRPWRTSIWDDRFLVTPDGNAFVWEVTNPGDKVDALEWAMVGYGPDGRTGSTVRTPPYDTNPDNYVRWGGGFDAGSATVPFARVPQWTMRPDTAVVWGDPDAYRLTTSLPDGSELVIERRVPPVALQPGEFDQAVAAIVERARGTVPQWTWSGPSAPDSKPYFLRVAWSTDGNLWVLRELDAVETECSAPQQTARCWSRNYVFDVFDESGRLATSIAYDGNPHPFVRPIISRERIVLPEVDDRSNAVFTKYTLLHLDSE